jgi:16S rRNA (cytosine1402-N4)-methyltransferase
LGAGAAPWPASPAAAGAADGVFVDLGASSHQLDPAARRGFSLRDETALDMRFWSPSPDDAQLAAGAAASPPLTASDLVNGCSQGELRLLLRDFGEERHAAHIARAIVAARPLASAAALARVVGGAADAAARAGARRGAAPRRRDGDADGGSRHPATRALQALRIAVNGELAALATLLADAPALLAPGGRFAALTFHSLEDRMVKSAFGALVASGGFAHAATPAGAAFVRASADEVAANPRARSATLRVVARSST